MQSEIVVAAASRRRATVNDDVWGPNHQQQHMLGKQERGYQGRQRVHQNRCLWPDWKVGSGDRKVRTWSSWKGWYQSLNSQAASHKQEMLWPGKGPLSKTTTPSECPDLKTWNASKQQQTYHYLDQNMKCRWWYVDRLWAATISSQLPLSLSYNQLCQQYAPASRCSRCSPRMQYAG